MEAAAELDLAMSDAAYDSASTSVPTGSGSDARSATENVSSPPLAPLAGGFRRPHFGRRLSGAVTLASFESRFPIEEPAQLARFDQMLVSFPSPPIPDPFAASGAAGQRDADRSPAASSPGSGWTIKGLAASLFSSR